MDFKRIYCFFWAVGMILSLILTGCTPQVPTPQERLEQARALGTHGGLEPVAFNASEFDLAGWQKLGPHTQGQVVHVYIEGDGLAWVTPSRISDNPTPTNPIGLRLALQDPAQSRLYLGRPCQYVSDAQCAPKDWTSHRFSSRVVAAYDDILNQINARYQPASFVLMGYSGGGAVAALLAAQREDVSLLVTVAGNLDIDAWVRKHGLCPLSGSLNPTDFMDGLSRVPQYHFLGSLDQNISPELFYRFEKQFQQRENLHLRIQSEFDHCNGWVHRWPKLLESIPHIK